MSNMNPGNRVVVPSAVESATPSSRSSICRLNRTSLDLGWWTHGRPASRSPPSAANLPTSIRPTGLVRTAVFSYVSLQVRAPYQVSYFPSELRDQEIRSSSRAPELFIKSKRINSSRVGRKRYSRGRAVAVHLPWAARLSRRSPRATRPTNEVDLINTLHAALALRERARRLARAPPGPLAPESARLRPRRSGEASRTERTGPCLIGATRVVTCLLRSHRRHRRRFALGSVIRDSTAWACRASSILENDLRMASIRSSARSTEKSASAEGDRCVPSEKATWRESPAALRHRRRSNISSSSGPRSVSWQYFGRTG